MFHKPLTYKEKTLATLSQERKGRPVTTLCLYIENVSCLDFKDFNGALRRPFDAFDVLKKDYVRVRR